MSRLRERVEAEIENIDEALKNLPDSEALSELSILELAGVAALLNSFYNGVENIIKQVVTHKGFSVPDGEAWHRDLIEAAAESGVLSGKTRDRLREYLAFRHFFTHAYAFDVDPARIEPLVSNLPAVYGLFRKDLKRLLSGSK